MRPPWPGAPGLLVAGTTSDAGKSVVTTGLCRVFARRGLRVAPYKALKMSNSSMVTADGAEIGRAQWVQALAARVEASSAMNPVLLKPGGEGRSHVVIRGYPAGELRAHELAGTRSGLAAAAHAAFDELRATYDVVVCEGEGSPAEISLRRHDFVNMGLARYGGIPTVVVGDADRGGVLASLFGTLALLSEADQALVAGFVVNRFRGDEEQFRPGVRALEEMTGRPVHGVVPWQSRLWLDSGDALTMSALPVGLPAQVREGDRLRVAVVAFPRLSNVTDIDALALEPNVSLSIVDDVRGLAGADLVLLPGTRATISDLAWLHERGLAEAVRAHAATGGAVLGIGGGHQMLGHSVLDPDGVEGGASSRVRGLGLLDTATRFRRAKVLRLCEGRHQGLDVHGYEIHHGRVEIGEGDAFPGGVRSGNVYGTLWHGLLEGDDFRTVWLREVAAQRGLTGFRTGTTHVAAAREERIDTLADALEKSVDVDALLDLALHGAPPGLPVVRGGMV